MTPARLLDPTRHLTSPRVSIPVLKALCIQPFNCGSKSLNLGFEGVRGHAGCEVWIFEMLLQCVSVHPSGQRTGTSVLELVVTDLKREVAGDVLLGLREHRQRDVVQHFGRILEVKLGDLY